MTTLQKIKNLTWWNEIAKLKIILTELLASSGGSQNLQQVVDRGNTVIDEDGIKSTSIAGGFIQFGSSITPFKISSVSGDDFRFVSSTGSVKIVPPSTMSTGYIQTLQAKTGTMALIEDIDSVFSTLPTYADNTAATTGGLAVGKPYKTATGQLMVRI